MTRPNAWLVEGTRILIVTSDFHTRRALTIFHDEVHGKTFSIAAQIMTAVRTPLVNAPMVGHDVADDDRSFGGETALSDGVEQDRPPRRKVQQIGRGVFHRKRRPERERH